MDDTSTKTIETSGQVELAAPQSESTEPELWIESLESIWAEPRPMTWLVDGMIPEQSVVMVAGESGCGKSTLLLALADAVSHGSDF
jgi:predicted ATP-dependent serine protease